MTDMDAESAPARHKLPETSPVILAESKMTWEDCAAANRLLDVVRSAEGLVVPYCIVVLIVLTGISNIISGTYRIWGIIDIAIGVIVFISVRPARRYCKELQLRWWWRKARAFQFETRWQFFEELIIGDRVWVEGAIKIEAKWSLVDNAIRGSRGFLLHFNGTGWYWIPNEAFNSNAAIEKLDSLLQRRVKTLRRFPGK